MAKYRVLSLDGGGIRGIISVILLQRLSRVSGLENFLSQVDLFAGTSTGGLLALALAKGLSLETLCDLYMLKGKEIFDDSWLDDVLDLATVVGAEYDYKNLAAEVKRILKDTKLGDLPRSVLVTSFDLDNECEDPAKRRWKPKIFHNVPGKENDSEELAYKAALYTSVAPTYFPSYNGFIDGGVYASNPSMCALAQTQDSRNKFIPLLTDVVLLSIGTGTPLNYIKGRRLDWGYAQWVKPLISLMLDGTAGIAHFQCSQLLDQRYHRLAPDLPPGVCFEMDDAGRVQEMADFATHKVNIDQTAEWLKAQWM